MKSLLLALGWHTRPWTAGDAGSPWPRVPVRPQGFMGFAVSCASTNLKLPAAAPATAKQLVLPWLSGVPRVHGGERPKAMGMRAASALADGVGRADQLLRYDRSSKARRQVRRGGSDRVDAPFSCVFLVLSARRAVGGLRLLAGSNWCNAVLTPRRLWQGTMAP